MLVEQLEASGLKRRYKVVVPQADLNSRAEADLATLSKRIKINGFRPGKVPASYVKNMYGRDVMREVIEKAISEGNQKIIQDNDLKLASQPRVNFPAEADLKKAIEGQGDLSVEVELEMLPEIKLPDFSKVKADKISPAIDEKEVMEAFERLSNDNRSFEPKGEKAKAAKGDRVTIDFKGSIDGVAFEGGTGENMDVDLGTGTFIPGFEDGLEGAKVGENREIKATFPADYGMPMLAGKEALFETTVKAISAPGAAPSGEELAKSLGFDDEAALKDAIRERLAKEMDGEARQLTKKNIFDVLEPLCTFELPASLIAQELRNVRRTLTEGKDQAEGDDAAIIASASDDEKKIANRRVKLGLLLTEIGQTNNLVVTDEELRRAMIDRARMFPGQERMVFEYYQKNPQAIEGLRPPVFEEKVVDFLLTKLNVTEKKLAKAELEKLIEAEAE
jgi:trigger factor